MTTPQPNEPDKAKSILLAAGLYQYITVDDQEAAAEALKTFVAQQSQAAVEAYKVELISKLPPSQECDYHGEGEEDSCVGCAAASEHNKTLGTVKAIIKEKS